MMDKSAQYFLSIAFAFFMGTGLAVGYFASQLLLTVVAYLSPWLPVWMWYIDIALFGIAVVASATSTVGVIAVLSRKTKALKLCWYVLVGVFILEAGASFYMSMKKEVFRDSLSIETEEIMRKSQSFYSTNISDTQMWDEIQLEINCCGVKSYKDWFAVGFDDGKSVPDSCCLLIENGCGKDVQDEDDIVTKGCHPMIMTAIKEEFVHFTRNLWLPILATQLVLIVLMLYFVHKMSYSGYRTPNIFLSVSSGQGGYPVYQPLGKQ